MLLFYTRVVYSLESRYNRLLCIVYFLPIKHKRHNSNKIQYLYYNDSTSSNLLKRLSPDLYKKTYTDFQKRLSC